MTGKEFANYRFATALAIGFAFQLIVIGVFLLPVRLDMDWGQRAAVWTALALLLLLALGLGLNALFKTYIAPILRLAEDAALVPANPGHRARPEGAFEVCALTDRVNALAAAHQALHEEVLVKIEKANHALAEEKNRLAALMSELEQSVLVCNLEGRILLYNARAKQLLEAAHGAGIAPRTAAIGLGRSVFGAIEHGLIVHALEQIQYRLGQQGGEAARPVSGFVATLDEGRMVRAHMAPVLDDKSDLVGFVLTLEDITRTIEANSHRDALLLCLTQETRAALGNIRAAVEAMQMFPDMSGARRTQFAGIIDEESQRLARRIERAMQEQGDHQESQWLLEDMRGADLVALLLRRIAAPSLRTISGDAIDATLWLKVDSYALSQALIFLARHLGAEAGVRELRFDLQRGDRLACLDITWVGAPVAAETLSTWENVPLPISAGAELTLNTVIALHGGIAVYRAESSRSVSRYRLMLPFMEPQAAFSMPLKKKDRPEFYDFDLFHQPGQTAELDQSLLTRLTCTVFDTETTGLRPAEGDEIISIGALRIVNGRLLQQESFDQLVKPRRVPSAESTAIHGITDAMLESEPTIEKVLPQFRRFAEDSVLIAHNAAFDMRFLQMQEARTGTAFTQPVLDTLLLSQVIHSHQQQHTLEAIAARLGVPMVGRHTALGDAIVTGEVFLKMIPLLAEKSIFTLKDARDAAEQTLYARIQY